MMKLVLLRHGESIWNRENRFTGWTDVGLSETGISEAHNAGQILRREGYIFDLAFTSYLRRAIHTLWIVLKELEQEWIPVYKSWRLNERHYGALQGLNKAETAAKYSEEQVHIWRRSFDTPPPLLDRTDPRFPGNDPRYHELRPSELPLSESLKDTIDRFLPYWHEVIAPQIQNGKRLLVAAHGNSIRALVKYLDNVPEADITRLNIPTGIPLVYELDDNLKPVQHYYLGDQTAVQRAIKSVADQGKAKK